MKKLLKKNQLRPDTVISDAFHVGIELELIAPCEDDSCGEHDDDACADGQRSNYENESTRSLLMDYMGLDRSDADSVSPYFNRDEYIDSLVEGYECCDPSECGYTSRSSDGDATRENLESGLTALTGNDSFKVVEDGSIQAGDGTTDAEVCWNYFASKETIKDNAKILKYLADEGCEFNKSCGLHINLNNYLKLDVAEIETAKLDFLFNFVGASRRKSSFCNAMGVSNSRKYSMIYHQRDRLEFRFFSPTLDAEKLNHYVSLANVVYRRLAGIDAKLSKKAMKYFFEKMTGVNGVSESVANDSLKKLNSLKSLAQFAESITNANADFDATAMEFVRDLVPSRLDRESVYILLARLIPMIDEADSRRSNICSILANAHNALLHRLVCLDLETVTIDVRETA